MKIKLVQAQEILDSRGNPTIEAVTILEDGSKEDGPQSPQGLPPVSMKP